LSLRRSVSGVIRLDAQALESCEALQAISDIFESPSHVIDAVDAPVGMAKDTLYPKRGLEGKRPSIHAGKLDHHLELGG
jgi:hypothetical protein